MVVFRRELKNYYKSFLIWVAVIAMFGMGKMSEFTTFVEGVHSKEEALAQFSSTIVTAMGMDKVDITNVLGYFSARVFSMIMLLGCVYAIMLAAIMLAKEEDDKTIEFLLSKPIVRSTIVTSKLLCVTFYLALFNIIMFLATVGTFQGLDADGTYKVGTLAMLYVGSFIANMTFALLGVFISTFISSAKTIYPLSIGIVLGEYMLTMLTNSSEKAEAIKYINIFSYVDSAEVVNKNGLDAGHVVVLLVITAVFTVLTYVRYNTKDIAA